MMRPIDLNVLDIRYWASDIRPGENMARTKRVSEMSHEEIKSEVKKTYAGVAKRTSAQPAKSGCCEPSGATTPVEGESCGCGGSGTQIRLILGAMGYPVRGLPDSVIESFAGCGNPVAIADLKDGETVLDLGSGAGLDVFMAAKKVGETGRVIGVDMTPEMLEKARANAKKMGASNVEFRQGDIERLPIQDDSVDAIISNCVINLAPDKSKVFRESYRVLRPGGRMMISDIVLEKPLTEEAREEVANYTGCLGGAILEADYLALMREVGFEDVKVVSKWSDGQSASAKIRAVKPKSAKD